MLRGAVVPTGVVYTLALMQTHVGAGGVGGPSLSHALAAYFRPVAGRRGALQGCCGNPLGASEVLLGDCVGDGGRDYEDDLTSPCCAAQACHEAPHFRATRK
jgi:hypothetical protein